VRRRGGSIHFIHSGEIRGLNELEILSFLTCWLLLLHQHLHLHLHARLPPRQRARQRRHGSPAGSEFKLLLATY
jgi:hypothetical protein